MKSEKDCSIRYPITSQANQVEPTQEGDAGLSIIDCQMEGPGYKHCVRFLLTTNMSGEKKNCFRLILDSLTSCLPPSSSPSRAPSPLTSCPTSCMGHNTHIQLVNLPVSAAQEGSSCRGMNSIMSLRQRLNRSTLVAKDYVKITLIGTYELLKITKESSAVLAPLTLALDGVIACVDLYKVSFCSIVDVDLALFHT